MCRRSSAVVAPALSLLGLLCCGSDAQAHRLEVQLLLWRLGIVQVESFFETGEVPKGARVQLVRADGTLAAEKRLDADGVGVFTWNKLEPLQVVVEAGAGHREEKRVTTNELAKNTVAAWAACATPGPEAPFVTAWMLELSSVEGAPLKPVAPAEHPTGPQFEKLALGVGLLLLVAGGAMLLRRVRQARAGPG